MSQMDREWEEAAYRSAICRAKAAIAIAKWFARLDTKPFKVGDTVKVRLQSKWPVCDTESPT